MPHAVAQLTAEIAEACATSLVLTPTERLARNLRAAYDAHQEGLGRRAWDSARIATLERYLWERLAARRTAEPGLPRLLTQEQTYLLFRRTAPAGGERMTPQAIRTFEDCQAWEIPIDARHFAATENGRVFLRWAERARGELDRLGAITPAELPRALLDDAKVDPICLFAFENPPRSITRWLATRASLGASCAALEIPRAAASDVVLHRFDDAARELAAIAHWCRCRLETALRTERPVQVGVVVPDLTDRYTAVLRAFTAEFDPRLEAPAGTLPFDLGGGLPLSATPAWRAADGWLALCHDRVPAHAALETFNDRYLALPRLARLPVALPALPCLADIARQVPALRAVETHVRGPGRRTLAAWAAAFENLLDAAGWTGARAGSSQFQALVQIRARFAELRREPGSTLLDARAALDAVRGLLSAATFAPERDPAPIQVMGYLETTGLRFTDLWVSGLDEDRWPALPVPDPFLPLATRRRLGLPRSTPALETVFARARLAHWRAACDRLVVSHARYSGERELRPSPLLDGFPERPFARESADAVEPPGTAVALESLEADAGRPVPAGALPGGVAVLRDQALCPFRGWAIHRLGLAEPRAPHTLPDPLDRGIAVHEALHALGRAARERGLTIAGLDARAIDEAARLALERSLDRFPQRFRTREHARLVELLTTWQTLESDRHVLGIESLEASTQIEIEGLALDVRIDRIDRLPGGLAVIDYKTGRPASLSALGGAASSAAGVEARLVEPQLPLYALTDPGVRGVLYAHVRPDRADLIGIAETTLDLAPARVQAPEGEDWQRQTERWRRELAALAAEVRDGYAAVAPAAAEVCTTCHLASLCRIRADSHPGTVVGP